MNKIKHYNTDNENNIIIFTNVIKLNSYMVLIGTYLYCYEIVNNRNETT